MFHPCLTRSLLSDWVGWRRVFVTVVSCLQVCCYNWVWTMSVWLLCPVYRCVATTGSEQWVCDCCILSTGVLLQLGLASECVTVVSCLQVCCYNWVWTMSVWLLCPVYRCVATTGSGQWECDCCVLSTGVLLQLGLASECVTVVSCLQVCCYNWVWPVRVCHCCVLSTGVLLPLGLTSECDCCVLSTGVLLQLGLTSESVSLLCPVYRCAAPAGSDQWVWLLCPVYRCVAPAGSGRLWRGAERRVFRPRKYPWKQLDKQQM